MFVMDKLLIAAPGGKKKVAMVMVGLQQNIWFYIIIFL